MAAVLGVSRNHAYTLFSRARDQLEASVAVLLVGRAGRGTARRSTACSAAGTGG